MLPQIHSVDPCVSVWLRDVRNVTEMECTSILLAKSISRAAEKSHLPKFADENSCALDSSISTLTEEFNYSRELLASPALPAHSTPARPENLTPNRSRLKCKSGKPPRPPADHIYDEVAVSPVRKAQSTPKIPAGHWSAENPLRLPNPPLQCVTSAQDLWVERVEVSQPANRAYAKVAKGTQVDFAEDFVMTPSQSLSKSSPSIDNPVYWQLPSAVSPLAVSTQSKLPRRNLPCDSNGLKEDAFQWQKDSLLSEESWPAERTTLLPRDPEQTPGRLRDTESSLDSACGSSPLLSSHAEDSPVRTSSPVLDPPSRLRSGVISSPDVRYSKELRGFTDPLLPLYRDCKDNVEKLLYFSSKCASYSSSLASDSDLEEIENFVASLLDYLRSIDFLIPHFINWQVVEVLKDRLQIFLDLKKHELQIGIGITSTSESINHLASELKDRLSSLNERVLFVVCKIILHFLSSISPTDPYLEIALCHLAYCGLFGDSICLEIVQIGGINVLVWLLKGQGMQERHQRHALRALAVLCSVSKACVQLLSLGGLDLVVRALIDCRSWSCTVEAAGVLAQLTAPCHIFATLPPSLSRVISRLLDLCDKSKDADSFLLCSAALANLSVQHSQVSDLLYRNNAVRRLMRIAFTQDIARSSYAKDQIVTILCRLSATGHEQMIIAQGGVPCLLSYLQWRDHQHPDLSARIRSKAAIALGNVADSGYGIKVIHQHCGGIALKSAFEMENGNQSPVKLICKNLLARLTAVCDKESLV